MNNQEIDKALKDIFELLTETNVYIDKQAPWILKKSDIKRMNVVLSISIELIKRSSFMLFPIIPSSCSKVFHLLNRNICNLNFDNILSLPQASTTINKPVPIFPRIDTDD